MKTELKIYLWVSDEGWKEFNLSDKKELESRRIYIHDGARIGYGALIGYGARIGDEAIIGDGARIGDGAIIGYEARIGDNITPKIIGIHGSKHFVNYWGEDAIQIGCKKLSIQEWLDNFEKVGISEGYSTEQIAEYKGYIDMIVELHKTWKI